MNGFSLVIASKIDFFKINKYELVRATFFLLTIPRQTWS